MRGLALGLALVGTAPSAASSELELDNAPFDLELFVRDPTVSPFEALDGLTLEAALLDFDLGAPLGVRLRFETRDGDRLRPGVYLDSSGAFAIEALRRDATGSATRLKATFVRFGADGLPASSGRVDVVTDLDPILGMDVAPDPAGSVRQGSFGVQLFPLTARSSLAPEPEASPDEARARAQAEPTTGQGQPTTNEADDTTQARAIALEPPSPRRRRSFLFAQIAETNAEGPRAPATDAERNVAAPSANLAERAFLASSAELPPSIEPTVASRAAPVGRDGLGLIALRTPATVDRPLRVQSPDPVRVVPAHEAERTASRASWLDAIASAVRVCTSWLWRHWPW